MLVFVYNWHEYQFTFHCSLKMGPLTIAIRHFYSVLNFKILFCYSDFSWNYFQRSGSGILQSDICRIWIYTLKNFSHENCTNFIRIKFQMPRKLTKWQFMISRKIWMRQIFQIHKSVTVQVQNVFAHFLFSRKQIIMLANGRIYSLLCFPFYRSDFHQSETETKSKTTGIEELEAALHFIFIAKFLHKKSWLEWRLLQ